MIALVNIRTCLLVGSALLAMAAQTGCMTIQRGSAVVQNTDRQQYNGKKIVVLPVKTQVGVATDSILPLKQEVNKRLGSTAKSRLPNATIIDVPAAIGALGNGNLLSVYEQVITTYDNTGVFDRKQLKALGVGLGSDYLVFTKLKAEKMDVVISKAFGASIDVMLVNVNSGEITWSGTGEWKRGGIYGAGGTDMNEAATRLVELGLSTL